MLISRIFPAESGVHKVFGEIGRRNVVTRLQVQGRGQQMVRQADPRQQGSRRGHDHTGLGGGDGVERPGPGRCHADVRRQAPVRIDLMRGKRQDRTGRDGTYVFPIQAKAATRMMTPPRLDRRFVFAGACK